MHITIIGTYWNAQKICTLYSKGHERSLIFVFERGKFNLCAFQIFLFCSLIRSLGRQIRVIISIGSQAHGLFVPGSMHTVLLLYGSRLCTIVSINSDTAVSVRSFVFFCGSFDTILFCRSRSSPTDSQKWLIISILSLSSCSPLRWNGDAVLYVPVSSLICLILTYKRRISSFESLLIYLMFFKKAWANPFLHTLSDLSSPWGVTVAPTSLHPANADVPLTSIFEDEICAGCWEVLLVIVNLATDLCSDRGVL